MKERYKKFVNDYFEFLILMPSLCLFFRFIIFIFNMDNVGILERFKTFPFSFLF
jgi:hypothetical protein